MESLKSFLSRSQTVKRTYEFVRKKASETYRRANQTDTQARYNEIARDDEDGLNYALSDSGLPVKDPELVPHPEANNPVLTRNDVTDCWARFVADPFVVHADGLYNLFFEIKSMGGHVFIGHAFSRDGVEYEYNGIIMQPEGAQHTYPHMFKRDGTWLLVPSPGTNVKGEFRVYEAVEFPSEWALRAAPIEEDVRLDPTPIYHDDTWYLIYQQKDSYDVVLKYADTLTGEWKSHPRSPLFEPDPTEVESSSIGKAEMVPSGRPLYVDGDIYLWYRSHLDRSVYRYRITELTTETFGQEQCGERPVFEGQMNQSWNRRFMHTVNPVYPWKRTENVVAVDGLESDQYRWSIGIYAFDGG